LLNLFVAVACPPHTSAGLVRQYVWWACPPVSLAGITMQLFYKQSCALQLHFSATRARLPETLAGTPA